jgi:hypothetical protein
MSRFLKTSTTSPRSKASASALFGLQTLLGKATAVSSTRQT